jgi:hypothetical protein|nr:MAG TPA: hypothetical protein [Caudoviricetes sp.]
MEVLIFLLEIFDKITCLAALCFGIFIIPYSLYNAIMYIIIKIKYWRNSYENRRGNLKN